MTDRPAVPPPPPPHAAAPVAPSKTSGFATASLVLGILGVIGIIWVVSPILALVFGYVAKGQIDRSGGTEQGRGMAIAGIVLGWVGIALGIAMAVWAWWFFTNVFPDLPFDELRDFRPRMD